VYFGMPNFIRADMPGGMFFFTLVTYERRPIFQGAEARRLLRESLHAVQRIRPFTLDAVVLLPDHLQCMMTLPENDEDFSTRLRKIKEGFTRRYLATGGTESQVTDGQARKELRGVWQQRFWEHTIRDDCDFERHMNYIHFNPVKHQLAACAHAWPWSSFKKRVRQNAYELDWCCSCDGRNLRPPSETGLDLTAME